MHFDSVVARYVRSGMRFAIGDAARSGVDPNLLLSEAGRSQLAPAQLSVLQMQLGQTLGGVFLVFVIAALLALVALSWLPGRRAGPELHAGPFAAED